MSLFFCGITLSHYNYYNLSEASQVSSSFVFEGMAYISETIVFAYIGTNYDITFDFQATDEMSMFAVKKTFQLTERQNLNFSWQNAEKDSDDHQRFLLSYNFDW